ncbi:LCP family protein [Streptomyces sp. NBC_00704]|uniref:LCP family protein n=1 Tax=Streptomyces sp. NBC_00704 TaxID=2975809 RepID=UPI002E36FE4E|nr:LCP family protein [Streptomyces sp. NBC_00704]
MTGSSGVRGNVSATQDAVSATTGDATSSAGREPGDTAASEGDGRRGGGRRSGRETDRRRRRRRALRWSATVLAVVILGGAGAGYLYYEHLNANIKHDDLNIGDAKDRAAGTRANSAGETALNILLIGSDARDTEANQKLGGAKYDFGGPPLADVQMLLHVSADRSNMSVVSMPRDTLLDIPKCTDPDDGKSYPALRHEMTNASLSRGGPGCTVATWEKLTDIHIDHFMMIDFAGVVSMADAIGGVPVCVDANVHSHTSTGKGSGLKLEKGTHPVKGEQALQWLRTRYGFEDDTDLARAKAQHMYMNSMVRELRASAKLTNPNKLRKLAEAATKAITVDDGLDTIGKMYDLAGELQKVPTDRITMTTMPNRYQGERVVPTDDAGQLFRLVREDIALDGKDARKATAAPSPTAVADPAAASGDIAVQVHNGTSTDAERAVRGRATAVKDALAGKGFAKAVADASPATAVAKTVVSYPSADLQGDALAVAKALGIPAGQVKKSTEVSGVTVVVGADWRSGTAYKAPVKNDRTPDTAGAINASDTGQCMHVDPDYTW